MSSTSGGGGPPTFQANQDSNSEHSYPGQVSGHSAWAGAGALGGASLNNRTFEQIIEEEKKTRNIIEIHLTRNPAEGTQPRALTFDDLGELIFDVIKINPDDCVSFDYNTVCFDTKHIQLKHSIQADQLVATSPILFKGHFASVS